MKKKLLFALLLLVPLLPFAAETNPDIPAALAPLAAKLEAALGKWNLGKDGRISGMDLQAVPNACVVTLLVNDNFSSGLIEEGFVADAWKLLQLAYADPALKGDIVIGGAFPVRDVHGKRAIKRVGMVWLKRAEFAKLDLKNFRVENLKKIAAVRFSLEPE